MSNTDGLPGVSHMASCVFSSEKCSALSAVASLLVVYM